MTSLHPTFSIFWDLPDLLHFLSQVTKTQKLLLHNSNSVEERRKMLKDGMEEGRREERKEGSKGYRSVGRSIEERNEGTKERRKDYRKDTACLIIRISPPACALRFSRENVVLFVIAMVTPCPLSPFLPPSLPPILSLLCILCIPLMNV
jgi:hypothetical protein